MSSITIISGTNRIDSHTEKIANYYVLALKNKGIEVDLFSLKNLPSNFLNTDLYGDRTSEFQKIIDASIEKQTKFIFISPEYNGSYAGILKVFLDAVSPKLWVDNKACLVGVATGRAGNLRGMEHLTNVLNYLKLNVFYNKLPISKVDTLLDPQGNLTDADTIKVINAQLDGFLNF